MIFLPYKIDLEIKKIPLFTILICIVCIFIFKKQYSEDTRHYEAVQRFCYKTLEDNEISLLRNISHEEDGNQCEVIFKSIREAQDSKVKLTELVKQAKPIGLFPTEADDFNYIYNRMERMYQRYESRVPGNLTDKLSYDPKDIDFMKMVTSTFSHGSISHLIGNLLFFYVFAASVEIIVGSLTYVGLIIITTIGTSAAYSYSVRGIEDALPTIGLSGVVMAAVAALAVMMPYVRIRCFFWFLIYFKIFRIPALFLAMWYVGWDIFEMNQVRHESGINYVAHVSGAAMGALLGLYFLIFKKDLLWEINTEVQ